MMASHKKKPGSPERPAARGRIPGRKARELAPTHRGRRANWVLPHTFGIPYNRSAAAAGNDLGLR
jgi:hypothetical protein